MRHVLGPAREDREYDSIIATAGAVIKSDPSEERLTHSADPSPAFEDGVKKCSSG